MEYRQAMKPKETFTCEYCGKTGIKSKAGLSAHLRHCSKAVDESGNPITTAVDTTTQKPTDAIVGQALKLRLHNKLSYREIATKLNCSKSLVHKAIKPFVSLLANPEAAQGYADYKAELIGAAELKVLRKIVDDQTVKKASLNNSAYALQILNNIGRLERGESTSNVLSVHADLEAMRKVRESSGDSNVPASESVIDGVN